MNNFEKNELVAQYLAQHPEHSDRQAAVAVGVSPTFVGKVRHYLQEKGKLVRVEKRVGQDGRRRLRRRSAEEIEKIRLVEEGKARKRFRAAMLERYLREKRKELGEIEIEMGFYRDNTPLAQKWLAELEAKRNEILDDIDFFEKSKWRE